VPEPKHNTGLFEEAVIVGVGFKVTLIKAVLLHEPLAPITE
jgi:hypothetical protein